MRSEMASVHLPPKDNIARRHFQSLIIGAITLLRPPFRAGKASPFPFLIFRTISLCRIRCASRHVLFSHNQLCGSVYGCQITGLTTLCIYVMETASVAALVPKYLPRKSSLARLILNGWTEYTDGST